MNTLVVSGKYVLCMYGSQFILLVLGWLWDKINSDTVMTQHIIPDSVNCLESLAQAQFSLSPKFMHFCPLPTESKFKVNFWAKVGRSCSR